VSAVQAYSARIAALQTLYNGAVWMLEGSVLAHAYVEHMLLPQVLGLFVGGIPRVSGMTLHYDAGKREWYVSTEGSNFLMLYAQETGLAIDRRRCYTTNVMELMVCLGLEAVCGVFANGDMARSLGIANASCKLLVDHLSSRGTWRGVNRTSITVGAAVLASVTIEDPVDRRGAETAPRRPEAHPARVLRRDAGQPQRQFGQRADRRTDNVRDERHVGDSEHGRPDVRAGALN
jgi:hypothetical protein